MKEIFAQLKQLDIPELTKIANNIKMVKVAQFVGVQGYAIRNSRCWGNCYRQKRTTKPKLSAQQVWEECHSEYLESIGNDNSGWEKYAEISNSIKKFASKNVKVANQLVQKNKEIFNNYFQSNVKSGISIGFSVKLAEQQMEQYYNEVLFTEINKLDKFAETSDPETKKILNGLSTELKKNAFWNELGKGLGYIGKQIGKAFQSGKEYLSKINDIRTSLKQFNNFNLPQIDKELGYLYSYLENFKNKPTEISKFSKQINDFTNILSKNLDDARNVLSFGQKTFGILGKAVNALGIFNGFPAAQKSFSDTLNTFQMMYQYANKTLGTSLKNLLAKPDIQSITNVQVILKEITTQITKMMEFAKADNIEVSIKEMQSELEANINKEKGEQTQQKQTQQKDIKSQISTVLKTPNLKQQLLNIMTDMLKQYGVKFACKENIRTIFSSGIIFSAKKIYGQIDDSDSDMREPVSQTPITIPTQTSINPATPQININVLADTIVKSLFKNQKATLEFLRQNGVEVTQNPKFKKQTKSTMAELKPVEDIFANNTKQIEFFAKRYDELTKTDPKTALPTLEKEVKEQMKKDIDTKLKDNKVDLQTPENTQKYSDLINFIDINNLTELAKKLNDINLKVNKLIGYQGGFKTKQQEKILDEKNKILNTVNTIFNKNPTQLTAKKDFVEKQFENMDKVEQTRIIPAIKLVKKNLLEQIYNDIDKNVKVKDKSGAKQKVLNIFERELRFTYP